MHQLCFIGYYSMLRVQQGLLLLTSCVCDTQVKLRVKRLVWNLSAVSSEEMLTPAANGMLS